MSEDYQAPSGAEHPITPPQRQVDAWCLQALALGADVDAVFLEAARWGADQELEACVEWVSQWRCMVGGNRPEVGLRAARRPKPPSLKQQALAVIENSEICDHLSTEHAAILRRALERLQELEGAQ